jgi:hypothetical protein
MSTVLLALALLVPVWTRMPTSPLQTGAPGLRTIAHDLTSGVDRPRETVARTDAEWAALWRAHAGDRPAPQVDLTANTIVAVFLGTRMTAGFDVEITGTRREGGALVVEWRETRPPPDAVTAQVITSPAHLVAIPRVEGEIRFEKARP